MTAANRLETADRYDRASVLFHWATVLLIAAAFASIEIRVLFERGTPLRTGVKELHYVLGTAILLLTLARLARRLGRSYRAPSVVPSLPAWQALAAKAMHWLLYAVLIALPIMGLLTVSALGDPMPIAFGIEIPALIAPNEELGEWLEGRHSLLGDTLYILIIGHGVAALAHHYLRRDTTLVRMMPARAAARSEATRPAE